MRVVAYSGEGRTCVETRPRPSIGPGELLLRLRVCGLCGTDLFKLANDSVPPATVLGHEIIGTVEELGDGVTGFAIGDRVVAPHHVACGECEMCERGSETMCEAFRENLMEPGGFSELVVIRERAVCTAARVVPDNIRDEVAVFLEPAACVLRGVERSGIEDAGTAVVIGGGSMGLLHVCVLRAVRPQVRIVLVEPQRDRRDIALELGVSSACEPDQAARAVKDICEKGADVVFDTVGGAKTLSSSLRFTRAGGSVVLFAHAPDGQAADFDLNELFKNERRVISTYSGSLGEQDRIWELIVDGRLRPLSLVTHRFAFDEFDEAVDCVRARRGLKVLLEPGG
jgi:L-iditol 2-dehydrogenase